MTTGSFRVAAIQACPVYLDLDATLDKACSLIAEAARNGAQLAVFPEAFIAGYPVWIWWIPAGRTAELRELYTALHASSIAIPDAATDRLCDAARRAGITVAIGVNERNAEASDSTLFNTLLFIGHDGVVLGRHRKLIPTAGERLIWGRGDGGDLAVYAQPFGQLSGLICWESYMPLARYALAAWGCQIYAAPTWDRGEPWLSTMKHVAKEMRALPFKTKDLSSADAWINPGDSVIVDPDGKVLAGPVRESEEILYADIHHDQLIGPRWQLDIAGHYARPDVFELRIHRDPRPILSVVDAPAAEEQES